MEATIENVLTFQEFYAQFSECLKLQEWKEVNNKPLAIFLRDQPENFFEYLKQILSEEYSNREKNQVVLIMKNLLQNEERLQILSTQSKKKLYGFLFELMISNCNKPEFFGIFNQIGEVFGTMYAKFPAEQSYFPDAILTELSHYKNINDPSLSKVLFFLVSTLYYTNSSNNNANLAEINDFVAADFENMTDHIFLASNLKICISLFKSQACVEHNPQLLVNILAILNKILDIEQCKMCPPIIEEFFGFFINFLSEATNLKISNNHLIFKVLNFQKTLPLELRKIFSIFLTNCTNSTIFTLNDNTVNAIFEAYLQTLADSIADPDEVWLQDISFDKMSSEQNNICDYDSLSHFHFISMILYSNLSDDVSLFNLKKFSSTTNWKMVCALLTALTNLVSFTDNETMSAVFPYIFSSMSYVNPKVRLAFLKLLEELSIEFGKDFYKKTHKVQESKILVLLDDSVPRIRIMATFTIISYLNDIPKKESKKKLQSFIPRIKASVDAKCQYFIPEILSLASEFVHQLDSEASEFAQELLPLVLSLKPEGLPPAEEANFNGKIMEFISIFIQAINVPSLVNPFKDQILNYLLLNQGKIKNAITLNDIYLLDAWQRMALIYRKEIQNYLAVVIGKMIPLGIRYMKDKEELREINEVFKGGFPRIYHTEVNRDQEVIKNLGEILKMFLESAEHEAIKNCESIIMFLNTAFKNIITGLKGKQQKMEELADEADEKNIFYEDFNYFYKDIVSCGFLFLRHYSHKTTSDEFMSTFRRFNNALWQIAEHNSANEKSLIKLLYSTLESIKFSLLEVPSESLPNHDLNQFIAKIKQQWNRVVEIVFEDYEASEEEGDGEEEEYQFVDLRIDLYFVIHEIITNLLKALNEDQKEILINAIFQDFYAHYFDEFYPKEDDLTEIEDDILSSVLFSLVEILQELPPEVIKEKLPWKKILENLIKYSTYHDELIRHNSCYALGLFHEKVETHHDIFPGILDYVARSIENLEKAAEVKIETLIASNDKNIHANPNSGTDNAPNHKKNEENEEGYESDDNDEDLELDLWECNDNIYSALGRMIKVYFGNNEFIKPDLIKRYLKYLPLKHDRDEGKDQHEILMVILLKFWNEILLSSEENYSEAIRIMGELCLAENEDIIELKTKKKVKKLCNILRTDNASKFTKEMDKLIPEKKKCLEECLHNKDLDED